MNSVTLTPVALEGYWRVKMTWPNKTIHFFGKFLSRAEAEKWIERHRWLTEQRDPAKGGYTDEGTNGR